MKGRWIDLPETSVARVIVIGEPIEGADPLCIGSLLECAEAIAAMPDKQRRAVCIWTEDDVYSADDALRMLASQGTADT